MAHSLLVMIDDVVMVMKINPPAQAKTRSIAAFEYLGFDFCPFYRNGAVIRYESNFRNLKIKLIYDKLILSGSWHKFYHGENWGDYTWGEIGLTVEELLETFGECFLTSKITKLAFASNLPIDPKPIIKRIAAIRGVGPSSMCGGTNHKSYGKYHKMTDFRYKVYDKQVEVSIHDKIKIRPILRLEKEIRIRAVQSRTRNPLKISTPYDLLKPKFRKYCVQELTELIHQIEFDNSIQVTDLNTSSDLEAFLFMNDITVRAQYKKLVTMKTFRSKKKQFDSLVAAYKQADLNKFLEIKVCEKISELAENSAHLKTG